MGKRAEVGTPKYLANAMKSKGLQRLRWFCQVCQKQCRDENGFKCHAQSESHLRQMLVVGESAGRHISDFSQQFQSEFVTLLSRRFGTKRVRVNQVYQEYIQDRNHLHMNATRWVTLTEFAKHLGRAGIARVDETEKGWFIAWIDNSPKALAKAEASLKKERATTSDEQRERTMINEQIQRAAAEAEATGAIIETDEAAFAEGLKRDSSTDKVVLSFSMSKPATSTSKPDEESSDTLPSGQAPIKLNANPLKFGISQPKPISNPLKANPLKPSNPLKTISTDPIAGKKREREPTTAEKLMMEEMERKRRKIDREGR